jgi:two-component system nitrogen regulation sensor histidine kinase NtrY
MVEGVFSPAEEAGSDLEAQDRRASFALPGLLLAGGALLCAILTLFVLLGLTPIAPTTPVVIASAVLNGIFVVGLLYLIGRELSRLLRARNRGRAAARLHIRVVALFSIVAITPAVLVALFASITLSAGL